MYYIVCNTADLIKSEVDEEGNPISVMPETTRISVDGTQAVLDDTQFAMLGMDEIDCQMLSQKKALALMETAEWKVTATEGE